MKKNTTMIGLISVLSIALIVVILFLLHPNVYAQCLVVGNDGYAVSNNVLTNNLLSATVGDNAAKVAALPVSSTDILYKKGSDYYVGENKSPLDAEYPIFSNDNSTLLTLSDQTNLITEDFEYTPGYLGLILNKGLSFNMDMRRAYREQFMLMTVKDGIYMNSLPILVSGSFFADQTIPANAIIRFTQQEIRYYSLSGDTFKLFSIKPMSESVLLTVDGKTYKYFEFLKKLGLFQEEDAAVSSSSAVSSAVTVSGLPAVSSATPSEAESEATDSELVSTVSSAVSSSVTSSASSQTVSSREAPQSPAQAAPAENPAIAPPVPPDEPSPPSQNPNPWAKPAVTLNAFTTTVYSVKSKGMTVQNPQFLATAGILFQVFDTQNHLVMSKSYTSSSDVDIEPLRPDTDFHIVVTMSYMDPRGGKLTETIHTENVHTKPVSDLTPLELNWQNGSILKNAIQIQNFEITNAVPDASAPDKTIDTVSYLSRAEINVVSQADSSKTYGYHLPSSGLLTLRTGSAVQFESNKNLMSNTNYTYTYVLYDRYANILPQKTEYAGETHTSKALPQAHIKMIKNEIKDTQIGLSFANPDKALIRDGSLYFVVYDTENNPVETAVTYQSGGASETGVQHALSADGANVQFTNLTDYSVYTIMVYGDCDVNDGNGMMASQLLGQSKFTTVSISTLGKAVFNVTIQNLSDHGADVQISYNKTATDPQLISLISKADISFQNADTISGSGISVTYTRDGADTPVGPAVTDGAISLTPEDITALQADGSLTFHVDGLTSKTDYNIIIAPKVEFGTGNSLVTREISSYYKPNSFRTLKKTPVIHADAIYASSSFIRLYGVTVSDPDSAVVSYPVTMAVYDSTGTQIATYDNLNTAGATADFNITGLTRDQSYVFRFFANKYNNGYDESSLQENAELFYEDSNGAIQNPLQITTHEAISGSIQVQSMNRYRINQSVTVAATGMTSTTSGVKVQSGNNRFNSNGSTATFVVPVNFGATGINSVRIRYSNSNSTEFKFYLVDPAKNPSAVPFADVVASEGTLGNENARWTETSMFDGNKPISGVQTVYVVAKSTASQIHFLWGLSFDSVTQSDSGKYYANLNAVINDPRLELGDTPSYMVRVYKNDTLVETREHDWVQNAGGGYTLNMYTLNGQNKTLADSVNFNGSRTVCNTNFYYLADSYANYRFEIYTTVFGYQIQIGKEEFYTDNPIIGLRTEEDVRNIVYGMGRRYFALNDISVSSATNNIGSGTKFTGELDFRGHTLTYASTGNLFQNIGASGTVKNMVITYKDGWGSDVTRATSAIIQNNSGVISNVMLIRNNGNVGQVYQKSTAGLVYMNTESGIIQDFVVKLKGSMIATNVFAPVCGYNRGLIRRGYVYGDSVQTTDPSLLTQQQYADTLYVGGVVALNQPDGVVEDVFSTVNINARTKLVTNDSAQGIVGYNTGMVRNSFYTGDVLYNGTTDIGYGPAYRNFASGQAQNTYYVSSLNYGATNNKQMAKQLLYYNDWYRLVLGGQNGQVPYDLAPLAMKCYPQVNWNWLMPEQEYVPLPQLSPDDAVRLLSATVTNQQDESADAVIIFHNPQNLQITSLTSQWLNFQVQSQRADGDFYVVNAHITLPAQTKYYSSYLIDTFSYSYGMAGLGDTVHFADGQKPSINAEFYKPMQTVQDWSAMKNDYQQNYRLVSDLNFNYFPGLAVLANSNVGSESVSRSSTTGQALDTFMGKLDGDGHTVNFGDFTVQPLNSYDYIIGKLGGTVKNLVVRNLNLTGSKGAYKGFIARMIDGSVVDNVQIYNVKAESYGSFGAIAGTMRMATIVNSSVHQVTASATTSEDDYQYIGSMVGRQSNSISGSIKIQNCYADGIDLHMDRASDCMGIGGLVGFIRFGADINHVYLVNGKISSSYKNVGGLVGAADTATDSSNGTMYQLNQFYVDVDIRTKTERAGGVIGFSGIVNASTQVKGLVLNDVTSNLSGANMVSRYYGNTDANTPSALYSYDHSRLNGVLNTPASGLLTYSQLCSQATYSDGGVLDWDSDFVRNTTADPSTNGGILPKLKYNNTSDLLPGQNDYTVRNDEVQVTAISSTPYSSGNLFVVDIDTSHPAGVTVKSGSFDALNLAELNDVDSELITPTSDTTTHMRYIVSINGYFDNYYLTGITYTEGGSDTSENIHINTGITPQYINIATAEDWNREMGVNGNGTKGYNIRITGDLDFSTTNGIAATNVNIASLIGADTQNWHTIQGINLPNGNQSLVDIANGRIAYLNFQNISMSKTDTTQMGGFGLFRVTTGDLHDLNFKNITLNSQNSMFVGISALAYGMNYNITMADINVNSTYKSWSPPDSATGGLIGRLSGSGALYSASANNVVACTSQKNAGGFVGAQYQGRYLWNISITNVCASALTSTAANPYAGGVAGYVSEASLANRVGDLHVRRAFVAGGQYTGGILGAGDFQTNTAGTTSTADDVFVTGTSANVGGVTGRGETYRAETHSSTVYGSRYVGGISGDGGASLCAVTDTVVGTLYDRNIGDATNTIFQNAVTARKNYYNALNTATGVTAGQSAVYTQAYAQLDYLVTAARINTFKLNPSTSDGLRVGGISPRGITFNNCIVANCSIGSYLADEVGGIVGAVEGPSVNTYWPYRVIGCGVQSSTVRGGNKIGGIAGAFYRDMMESCYSNATVTASGTAAGGIIGFMQQKNVTLSETPYVEHVYFAGSVSASDYAAGIIGQMGQTLFSVNDGWIMAGNVSVTTSNDSYYAQFLLNKQSGDLLGTTKAGVYTGSLLKHGLADAITAQNYYANNSLQLTADNVHLTTTDEFKTTANYASLFSWSTTYWNYSGLANSFMPYLTQSPWGSAASIMYYQEGYAPDPANPGSALKDAYGEPVYLYQKYTGGVPIPGSGAKSLRMMASRFVLQSPAPTLPKPTFYAVDADRLNIEFPASDENIHFEVLQDGKAIANSALTQRTFTLAYAYKTELEVRVYNDTGSQSYTIWPQDVSRDVMTWGTAYYYLNGQSVAGSTQNLPQQGAYINLYAGRALDAAGNVYDVKTGTLSRRTVQTELLPEAQPLHSFTYDGSKIDTYNGYSVSGGVVRDKLRLYVKDGKLSAVPSEMSNVGDGILLDSYDGKDYCSVLSTDGALLDMTRPLTLPKGFVNGNIAAMTNNLNSTSHLVLVRYKDGGVAGFNYLTGEPLAISSPRGNSNTSGGTPGGASSVAANLQTSYQKAQAFMGSLLSNGWSMADGSHASDAAAAGGSAGSRPTNGALTGTDGSSGADAGQTGSFSADGLVSALKKVLDDPASSASLDQSLQQLADSELAIAGQQGLSRAQIVSILLEAEEQADGLSPQVTSSLATLCNWMVERLTAGLNEPFAQATGRITTWGVSLTKAQELLHGILIQALKQGLTDSQISGGLTRALNSVEEKGIQSKSADEILSMLSQALSSYFENEETGKAHYIAVYDVNQKEYVLYNQLDLLSTPDDALKSVNEQVALSGHLMNYQNKSTNTFSLFDGTVVGFILLFTLAGGICVLVGYMILGQKRKQLKNT